MVDPKRVQVLEIQRNRQSVGTLERTPKGCIFRYTEGFLSSNEEAIARHLPKTSHGIETHGIINLPTFFAGLLPEGVMQDAIVRHERLSRDDLFSQLAVTGHDAIGDVTAHIPGETSPQKPATLDDLAEAIQQMAYGNQYHRMGAITGAQPKMSLGHAIASQRGIHSIVKIPPREYPGILPNEAYFMTLAPRVGLPAAKVHLSNDNLVIERFDRVPRRGGPAEQYHVEDVLQVLDLYPNRKYSLDFFEVLDAAQNLEVGSVTQLALFRLYAYSYCIGNGDLHAKNVSFLYNRAARHWRLTPAYDLLSTLQYFEHEKMALPLDDDFGNFSADDFVRAGSRYKIPERSMRSMLQTVGSVVAKALTANPPPIPAAALAVLQARAQTMANE